MTPTKSPIELQIEKDAENLNARIASQGLRACYTAGALNSPYKALCEELLAALEKINMRNDFYYGEEVALKAIANAHEKMESK